MGRVNEFNPNLKFTYEKSDKEVNFLDVVVHIEIDELVTDLLCKSVNGYQYL